MINGTGMLPDTTYSQWPFRLLRSPLAHNCLAVNSGLSSAVLYRIVYNNERTGPSYTGKRSEVWSKMTAREEKQEYDAPGELCSPMRCSAMHCYGSPTTSECRTSLSWCWWFQLSSPRSAKKQQNQGKNEFFAGISSIFL